MKKFEMSFQASWKCYIRTFDTTTGESNIHELPSKYESFVQDSAGAFQSFYKPEIRYRKVLSDFKTAKQNIGMVSPIDIVIRDQFSGIGTYNANPRVFYLDIETRTGTVSQGFPKAENAVEPVCLIQIKDSATDQIYIIGDKEFYFEKYYMQLPDVKDEKVQYLQCQSENQIFETFFNLIKALKPLIVYAWNAEGFDFPYLFNRSKKLGFDVNRFSPFAEKFGATITKLDEKEMHGKYFAKLTSAGIHYVDMINVYKKFILAPRESYSLMSIAIFELNCRKVGHSEFRTFDDFYQGNWKKPKDPMPEEQDTLCYKLNEKGTPYDVIQKAGYGQFVYYGIKDVVLICALDRKLGLTKLMVSVAEKQSSQLVDVLGTTKPWGNAIRNKLYKLQKVINPLDTHPNPDGPVTGGYVREPLTNKQEWVISADVNSMYPILAIAGSKMSPENFIHARDLPDCPLKTFVYKELKIGTYQEQNEENMLNLMKDPEKVQQLSTMLKEHNYSMAPNGVFFDLSKDAVIPDMVKDIYQERKTAKKEMIKAQQTVKAIQAEIQQRKELINEIP